MVEIPKGAAKEMTAVKMAAPLGSVKQMLEKNRWILRRSINKEHRLQFKNSRF